MSKLISKRAELDAALAALPPVRTGRVRVFRGQTENYPAIKASAYRGKPVEGRELWDAYLFLLARTLAGKIAGRDEPELSDLALALFWVRALSQHYGPGTEYLDVTHSVDVALWFASHTFARKTLVLYGGDDERPGGSFISAVRCGLYAPSTARGWLYVLDVPVASDSVGVAPGALIDIEAKAPAIFRTGTRLQVQKACLLNTRGLANGGDCRGLLAAEPFELAPEAMRNGGQRWRTAELFPSPKRDEWYARLLGVPLVFGGARHEGKLVATNMLPVEFVLDQEGAEGQRYMQEVMQSTARLWPLCAYGHLLQQAEPERRPVLQAAVPISLDFPLIAHSNPWEFWNQEVLWRNAGLKALDRLPEHPSAQGGFNLFFEFSPLEVTSWAPGGEAEGEDWERAVWLVSMGGEALSAEFLFQPGDPAAYPFSAIFLLWFDAGARKIRYRSKQKEGNIEEFYLIVAALRTALALIGDLSPGIKPKAFAGTIVDGKGLVKVTNQSARLVRQAPPAADGMNYGKIVHIATGAPYRSVDEHVEAGSRLIEIDPAERYATLTMAEIAQLGEAAPN